MTLIIYLIPPLTYILLEVIFRYLTYKYGNRISEFPISSADDLHKFVNYDPYLGWEPSPKAMVASSISSAIGATNSKITNGKVKYIINDDGSRWQPPPKTSLRGPIIEFFGDSTVFCSGNNHDETFHYYLETLHSIGPCKNFGVGNYGLDQAYLRAKKRMKGHGIAVLYLPVIYLYRLGIVYKHYNELGNSWAVKPRFLLDSGERDLEFVPRPFKKRKELLNLPSYAKFFRKHDNFYPRFKKMAPERKKSYLIHYLVDKCALNELTSSIYYQTNNKLIKSVASISGKIFRKILKKHSYNPHNQEGQREFLDKVKGEEGKIFALLASKFNDLANERDSKAIIILSSQGWTINNKDIYEKAVGALSNLAKLQGFEIYDFGRELFALDSQTLNKYLDHPSNIGSVPAHFSPAGNKFLASWLADLINEKVNHQRLDKP